jgi:putative ABC transport system permease protein
MGIFISTCTQGLIWSILALGVYITFKILNFADMTSESSLTLGGAISAVMILSGVNPYLSILFAGFIGSIAGLITGILHTRFKIQEILSGILTMIAFYSINLRVMGKANISLLGKNTIFSVFNNSDLAIFFVSLFFCLILIFLINLFFRTQFGMAVRATGDNEYMMRSQGANTDFKKIIALMISNTFCAISGALIAQRQGYADINMGTGAIVIALATIVIGKSIIKEESSLLFNFFSVVIGSIIYRSIILLVLNLGMNPSDLKLFTAIVATVLLALPNFVWFKKMIKRCVKC